MNRGNRNSVCVIAVIALVLNYGLGTISSLLVAGATLFLFYALAKRTDSLESQVSLFDTMMGNDDEHRHNQDSNGR